MQPVPVSSFPFPTYYPDTGTGSGYPNRILIRGSASRLWSATRSSLPAVVGPAPPDEPSHGYDYSGECEPKVDYSIHPLGTPHQLLVRVGPRIRAFYHPTHRCLEWSRLAFLGDHRDKATTP